MSLAYVLINAEIGKEKLCYNEVKQLGNVKEVYILYGFLLDWEWIFCCRVSPC